MPAHAASRDDEPQAPNRTGDPPWPWSLLLMPCHHLHFKQWRWPHANPGS